MNAPSEAPRFSPEADEQTRLLADMKALADRLCATEDAMLEGQYRYLRGRIVALIELRLATGFR